jgi:hypothetical protein
MTYQEQFEKETESNLLEYWSETVFGYSKEYVEWLETKLQSQAEQIERMKAERECPDDKCENFIDGTYDMECFGCKRYYPDLFKPKDVVEFIRTGTKVIVHPTEEEVKEE